MNAKKKGNAGENKFANWLQRNGIKAYRNASSGGNAWKSDVHNALGLNIEVKTVARLNLMEAWRQTDRDASKARSSPLLAIHFNGMREDEWLIVQHSNDWLERTKANAPEQVQEVGIPQSRELRYALSALKPHVAKVVRLLEETE